MGDLAPSVFALICFVGAAYGSLQEKYWGSYALMHTYQTPTTPITSTTVTPTRPIHPSPSITDRTARPWYKPTAARPRKSDIPADPWSTSYDAITVIEYTEEILIFKGRYFWRVDGKNIREVKEEINELKREMEERKKAMMEGAKEVDTKKKKTSGKYK